jgi:ComF family protein
MKHAAEEPLSAAMGQFLVLQRGGLLATLQPDLVVPVPMYWRQRLVRRTNSPDLLADRLAKFLRVSVLDRVLRRCRDTLPQKSLPPGRRFPNVRGAFRLAAGYDLKGARVLLVDDVLTTGATCNEAARVLKKEGGAEAVLVAVLARADGEDAS